MFTYNKTVQNFFIYAAESAAALDALPSSVL
jgi:hypothetical protein